MLDTTRLRSITLWEFAATFVPFGLLLSLSLLAPAATDNPTLQRVVNTIWLSTIFLIPGLALAILSRAEDSRRRVALLLLTFSYLAYMVHFQYATFVMFGGVAGIFANMRLPIAVVNLVLTAWWTFDIPMMWLAKDRPWMRNQRWLLYAFIFLVYVVTELTLRPTEIRYLGGLLAAVVVGSLFVRFLYFDRLAPERSRAESLPPARADDSPALVRARLWFCAILFLALMALTHGGAELRGWLDAQRPDLPGHTTLYYRVIHTIWATALLLIGALSFFALARPGAANAYWRGLWTVSYLAFLSHLFWTVAVMFRFDFQEIFHSRFGEAKDLERVVQNPGPDLFLAAWWTFDVLLLWFVPGRQRWIALQRGAVHVLTFVMFFGALVLAEKASITARLLGISMALFVLTCLSLRVVQRESDMNSLFTTLFVRTYQALNQFVPWHRLPTWLGVLNLAALRDVLREQNLHDTSDIPVSRPAGLRDVPPNSARYRSERDLDGYYNSDETGMGSASLNPDDPSNSSDFTLSSPGARFGRNIPLNEVGPLKTEKLIEPNPRLISNELLARRGPYVEAPTLNLLAAAWIQFQTHDWFNHGTPVKGREIEVPIPAGDTWPERPMKVRHTRPDPTRADPNEPYPEAGPADGKVATYVNAETHWWDGSEIYGSNAAAAAKLRLKGDGTVERDGKLALGENGLLTELCHLEQTGLTSNWWLGLSLLHNLFSKEHNAI